MTSVGHAGGSTTALRELASDGVINREGAYEVVGHRQVAHLAAD